MKATATILNTEPPHLVRLRKLASLAPADINALLAASRRASTFAARREILRVGATLNGPKILTRGWAAQVRDFRDGRRQILHVLIPGDMILNSQKPGAYAATTTVAITDASVTPAPIPESYHRGLGQAYALSADMERVCLLRQIARIGRLDAYERLADLFLELADRLRNVALGTLDSFELPLTQEMLADCLGLTPVHVNRTLQQMRREGMIDDRRRTIRLVNAEQLRSLVDYQPLNASYAD